MENRFSLGLDYLRTLQALRDHGTLTEAAAARHISGPSASAQLAALSKWVGAPLVSRRGRGVRLTHQALLLLEHGDIVLAELERAQADFAKFDAGQLGVVSIGTFASAIRGLVVPSLSILSRDRPGVTILVEESDAPECLSALDIGIVDLAITDDHTLASNVNGPRYQRIELLRDPLRAVVPANHRLARGGSVTMNELSDERWIVGTPSQPCSAITMSALSAASISPTIVHRCNDWHAVLSLIASGAGIALVPTLALDSKRPEVVELQIESPEPSRNICAVVRKGSEGAPHIAAVIETLLMVSQGIH